MKKLAKKKTIFDNFKILQGGSKFFVSELPKYLCHENI